MNEKIYLHTINNGFSDYYIPKKQREVLENILKSDKILSKRMQGLNENNTILNFCGLDYISLSDYEKRFVSNREKYHYNGYYAYVRNGLSLTFPQDKIDVIEPIIIGVCTKTSRDFEYMSLLGMDKENRYTDLPDEVQVKDSLSLDNLNGILFPTENFMHSKILTKKSKMLKLLKEELIILRDILDKYEKDVLIYDVDTLEELNSENAEDFALKL